MVIHTPYQEVDTAGLPDFILENTRNYLIGRIGDSFYRQLNYYSSTITDFRWWKNLRKPKGWIERSKATKRVKYSVQYYFVVQDGMRYYLSTVFDKDGNIISQHQLPSQKQNRGFGNLLNVCEVKAIAERDTVFEGKMEGISLEYLDSANAFVWRIEKPHVIGSEPREAIHRFLILNAYTGELIRRETERWVTIHAIPSF